MILHVSRKRFCEGTTASRCKLTDLQRRSTGFQNFHCRYDKVHWFKQPKRIARHRRWNVSMMLEDSSCTPSCGQTPALHGMGRTFGSRNLSHLSSQGQPYCLGLALIRTPKGLIRDACTHISLVSLCILTNKVRLHGKTAERSRARVPGR
jgi:hypothetical protein